MESLHRYNARASARRLAEQVRLTRIILDHRDVLGGRLRQVVNMTYDDGLSHAEIARKIGVTRRVVGTYLTRAHRLIGKVAVGMRVREREK
ncbi:MAG: sigma-70 region 4 domain-containing protein [Proteobacteria bacterium]|nr:sigma-70 region 4 domain-containing protein [Pseudomonadota bacterium]